MELDIVISLYQKVFKIINGNLPNVNGKQRDSIQKFLEGVSIKHPSNNTESWWFEFICFQFEFFVNKDTKFGKGVILPNWVFGKQAYHRWELRNDKFWKYWVDKFIEEYKIPKPRIVASLSGEEIDFYRENERRRYFNTERGVIHCKELMLRNIKSKSCRICKNNDICNGD